MAENGTITKLVENFEKFEADLKTTLNKQDEEIKANGRSTEETGQKVDDLTAKLSEIGQELKAVQAQADELEKRNNRPGAGADAARSIGARFVESEQYKNRGNVPRTDAVAMGSFFAPRMATLTSGDIVEPQRYGQIIAPPEREMRLRDLIDVAPTGSNAIEYVRETGFTNNAAPRAEGAAAGESALTLELASANVQNLTHFLPATREILNDEAQLRAYIDRRLLYGLELKEEQQMLYGNGTSPNLKGITTDANVQTYAWSDGPVGSKDTKVDAIRRAMTLARVAEYPVNGIVLNPNDWEEIELLKASDGKYIWVQVATGGESRLWRVPVVETNAVTAGTSVVGAFGMAATLWDREQGAVRVSDSHSDFFTTGKIAILAEERVALTVFRPEAFVAVTFDAAPAAA